MVCVCMTMMMMTMMICMTGDVRVRVCYVRLGLWVCRSNVMSCLMLCRDGDVMLSTGCGDGGRVQQMRTNVTAGCCRRAQHDGWRVLRRRRMLMHGGGARRRVCMRSMVTTMYDDEDVRVDGAWVTMSTGAGAMSCGCRWVTGGAMTTMYDDKWQ